MVQVIVTYNMSENHERTDKIRLSNHEVSLLKAFSKDGGYMEHEKALYDHKLNDESFSDELISLDTNGYKLTPLGILVIKDLKKQGIIEP